MAITRFTGATNTIRSLGDRPNQADGLTAAQLKAKFDQFADEFAVYNNETLAPQIENQFATKEEVEAVSLGQIADNSITDIKLDEDIKVGSLASLLTTVKTSVVNAINEVYTAVTAKLNKDFALPSVNLSYEGITSTEAIDGATTVAIGDVLCLSSTGYKKAQANSTTTIPVVAMAVEAGTGGTRKILHNGLIKNTGWSFTKGQYIYLSPVSAGTVTTTIPSTTGHQVQILGYAVSADTMYFNPQLVTVEI